MIRAVSRFQHSAPRAALAARYFPRVPHPAVIPDLRDGTGSSHSPGEPVHHLPSDAIQEADRDDRRHGSPAMPAELSRPSAMAPGVRRSESQIVGSPQDAAHPAEVSVSLSDDLLLTLRMAAAVERIALDEAVRRAISIYADGLGLQVLASALDLDPDLAMQFRRRTGLNRFKGGAP